MGSEPRHIDEMHGRYHLSGFAGGPTTHLWIAAANGVTVAKCYSLRTARKVARALVAAEANDGE